MISTFESKLAVDLQSWTFDVELSSLEGTAHTHTLKIPDHGILKEYAAGQKRLRLPIGHDKVFIPQELFEALLGEITSCQEVLRSADGQPARRRCQ